MKGASLIPRAQSTAEAIVIPVVALIAALIVFGIFVGLSGRVVPEPGTESERFRFFKNCFQVYSLMYVGGFGSSFAWQDTVVRASPLLLAALCTALPARIGLVIIGGEGALVLGGLFAAVTPAALYHFLPNAAPIVALYWAFRNTRWGLIVRVAGESADAARAMGYSVNMIRLFATGAGGFLAGIGGAFLSLFYPGVWNNAISSGQGLMAVALVIFARWNPVYCLYAALLFGGAGAIGPALQANGITSNVYLYGAAPYVLTLAIMVITCSPNRTIAGAPAELGASSR